MVSIFVLLFEELPEPNLIERLQLLENPFTFGDIAIARFPKGNTFFVLSLLYKDQVILLLGHL